MKKFKSKIDIKYFIIAAVGEFYGNEDVSFAKILSISKVLDSMDDADYVALLWTLCSSYDAKRFSKEYIKGKVPKSITNKYSMYLIK